MIVEHARKLVVKLRIPPEQQPRLGPSWLHCLQARYGVKWPRAFGESDSVNMDVVADEVKRLRKVIDS
ncbi:hypothetical protein PF008_g20533 [Phytophthora fragariae]|uniref:HTH CENPB-type domain-containing protein n=1 Tax=Phytophthora fragariae TaxID=53985 RepID=A0A6G0QZG9_9STRA|nr:hypothetical protein PF008_g20533 [Phytophthora fragariae]